jgi:hypothetical protein
MVRRSVLETAMRSAACAFLALAAAACQSTAPAEPVARYGAVVVREHVSGAELASRLGLTRTPVDDAGRVVLASDSGASILLFPETTVVSVRGIQLKTSEPVELRAGDAWLHPDDAAAIESVWASSPVIQPTAGPAPLPGPRIVPVPSAAGRYGDQPTPAEIRAWSVSRRGSQWHYIVIHHSATDTGSAAQFDTWHKRKGWDGLAYDFVIGNGTGSADGAVEVGYRWRQQKRGAHAGNDLMNIEGIGICLVGDFTKTQPSAAQMRSLSRLCNFLSSYCNIPRESYRLHGDVRDTSCPGPYFPRDFLAPQRSHRAAGGASAGGGTR